MYKKFKVLITVLLLCLISQGVWARVFKAKNNAFTIDLPSSWSEIEAPTDYLYLKNTSGATMRFVIIENCFDRQCLETIVEKEIKDLTKRKFTIIKDEYSGEFVRETSFSTQDPLLSFDFTKQNMLFTAGYFLSGGKAYNVGVRGIPYTEASYLLSFISPVPKETVPELQQDSSQKESQSNKLESIEQSDLLETEESIVQFEEKPKIQAGKKENPQLSLSEKTLKYIVCIFVCYLMLWGGAFFYKTFFPSKLKLNNTNPNSPYPLQGKRLYGSPDLFLRLHDNLGNHYIATATRWSSLFVMGGLFAFILFSLARLIFAIFALKATSPSLLINTFYSLSYLLSACGFIILVFGIVLNLVFPYKFLVYDSQGEILYKCVQKGFSLLSEQYFIATKDGQILCKVIRKNFSLLRTWKIFDVDKEIAEVKEKSVIKSLLRRIFGHLFGIFRTNYLIKAQMDSKGEIKSASTVAAKFSLLLDKPQAIPVDIMLVFSAVLFLRDRDKSFPWIN
jgi:hypothetical protein